jgi:GNAT superfamily N-acetyltransferase
MTDELTIRAPRLEDLETIACFQEEMARVTEYKTLEPETVRRGVRAVLEDPGLGFYLLAEERGQVIGGLMVTTEWSDWRNGRFYWIQSVFVRETHRRRGVYRRLHDEVRRRAQRAGDVVGIRLYVERDNRVAQQTYLAMGMEETPYRLFEEAK